MSKERLLIVEDRPLQLADLEQTFLNPDRSLIDQYSDVEGFIVDTADSGPAAQQRLSAAVKHMTPYDVLILDLGLPESEDDEFSDPEVGLDLFKSLSHENAGACTTTVIVTDWRQEEIFVKLLREGAAEFISKDSWKNENDKDEGSLFHLVVKQVRESRRIREIEWAAAKRNRAEKWLLLQSSAQVADRMARIVSDGIGTILSRSSELSRLIEEQFLLSPELDSDNPVCRAIEDLRAAATKTADDCAATRGAVSRPEESSEVQKVALNGLLTKIANKLRPVFAFNRVKLKPPADGDVIVTTFPQDLDTILRELLFSAIEATGAGGSVGYDIRRDDGDRMVEVTVRDEAPPIEQDVRELIEGDGPQLVSAGRGWGLSLARRVAHNIGARFEISADGTGNTVTLRIPATAND